jgi:hypothetical protein
LPPRRRNPQSIQISDLGSFRTPRSQSPAPPDYPFACRSPRFHTNSLCLSWVPRKIRSFELLAGVLLSKRRFLLQTKRRTQSSSNWYEIRTVSPPVSVVLFRRGSYSAPVTQSRCIRTASFRALLLRPNSAPPAFLPDLSPKQYPLSRSKRRRGATENGTGCNELGDEKTRNSEPDWRFTGSPTLWPVFSHATFFDLSEIESSICKNA